MVSDSTPNRAPLDDILGSPAGLPQPAERPSRRARYLLIAAGVVLIGAGGLAWAAGSGRSGEPRGSATETAADGDRFAYLASQDTNYCSLDRDTVMGYPDSQRIQGACCDAMDRDKYDQQVDGLRRYAGIPEIPQDPYDIEAQKAKELLGYDDTVTLGAADQAIFDTAMAMTEDGGPCCCQCWRWYMTEGLAKLLITREHLPAEQVAEIADLVNGCGGPPETG